MKQNHALGAQASAVHAWRESHRGRSWSDMQRMLTSHRTDQKQLVTAERKYYPRRRQELSLRPRLAIYLRPPIWEPT